MNPRYTRILRPVLALGLVVGLSACASVDTAKLASPDTTTRNTPVPSALNPSAEPMSPRAAIGPFSVATVNVTVPETLRVSEANRYYPTGDIVWREDPIGNRYEQVKAIVTAGLTQGVSEFEGEREVVLDVVVTRFHALTEKARYTVGGVHAIQFDMRILDAQTGAVLVAPRSIKADFDALGGRVAIAAEARGVTQKVRITNQLANVVRQELGSPGGYVELDTGLIGAINQL